MLELIYTDSFNRGSDYQRGRLSAGGSGRRVGYSGWRVGLADGRRRGFGGQT